LGFLAAKIVVSEELLLPLPLTFLKKNGKKVGDIQKKHIFALKQ
jgi:hypothetical protein